MSVVVNTVINTVNKENIMSPWTNRNLRLAALSFTAALGAGTIVMSGLLGANAATDTTCHIATPTETVNVSGNTTLTWTSAGDCADITVSLVAVTTVGEKTLATDSIGNDNTATFTYGTLPAGTAYDFRIQGASGQAATPQTLTTRTGQ
jgi:hypothetical protein